MAADGKGTVLSRLCRCCGRVSWLVEVGPTAIRLPGRAQSGRYLYSPSGCCLELYTPFMLQCSSGDQLPMKMKRN